MTDPACAHARIRTLAFKPQAKYMAFIIRDFKSRDKMLVAEYVTCTVATQADLRAHDITLRHPKFAQQLAYLSGIVTA
jgi:hypothetical protein